MSLPVIQPSFAAGELSPGLYSRIDLAKWHVGAALVRNFFINASGGASNRVGTQFIIPCLAGVNRLVDFSFNAQQTYALLFSDLKLRFITNGGALLEAAGAITGATQANPCALTQVAHGYATADWVFVSTIGGMTRLNGRFYKITVIDANHYSLADAATGVAIDSSAFTAYTAGGTAARVYTIVSPYAAADLALLKFTQSADVMTLTHPSYQPRQLRRTGAVAWAFSLLATSNSLPPPTGTVAVPAIGAAATTYRYVVTAVTAQGVESAPSAAGVTALAATMSTTAAENVTVAWVAPATGVPAFYRVYRQIEVPGGAPAAAELFGYVGTAAGLAFVDHNVLPDFTQTPPITYDPFAANVWPGCTTYYQGRQVYAGATSLPETMNFSKTGDFSNFSYSTPSRANDGIVATIASRKVNAIKHMMPMQSLVVLSASGAWRVDAGNAATAITPANINAVPQAFNGCNDVPPIAINYDILYVQAKGAIVRDLAYNFYVNVYTGQDMTVLASHLFLGHQILEWAWAEEPFRIVWAVREDGVLLSFTYLKEQEVYAWAHHDTAGQFKSVCSIAEGNEDAVYLTAQRTINGNVVQYVERMASRNMHAKPDYSPPVPAHLELAWFVDCGLQYPLTTPAATLTPASTGAAPAQIKNVPIVFSIIGVDVVNGGAGYSAAPTVIVTDALGTGSGAQLTATVAAGIITGYVVVNSGMNYQRAEIEIIDATGVGAVAAAILTNDVIMNASGAIAPAVGDMVRINDGWGPVRVINSATRITVNVQQALSNIYPAAAGAWSATTPVLTLQGLDHLEGESVSILADGNVVANGVDAVAAVANGTITLARAATAIVIGKGYVGQVASLYCDIPGQSPTAQGRRMSVSAVTVRVADTRGLEVGHDFVEMNEFKERDFQVMGSPILPYTGDQRVVIGSNWQKTPQVCCQQVNPLPATILGFIPEISVGDTPG